MRQRFGSWRCRLTLALGSLIATLCFAGEPLDTVRDCAATAPATLSGLKALSAVCPELQSALGALGLDAILYDGWQDKLSVHALQDVIELAGRYRDARLPGAPGTAELPGILQSLKDAQAPQVVSWWHSFKNWVKQWLEQSDSSIAKWIKHLLDGVLGPADAASGFLDAFVYFVTFLTAVAAVVLIVREFKAAGIGSRLRRARPASSLDQSSQNLAADAGEDAAAEQNTPAGLLRALVRRLLQTGRLTTERSLTHRELIARTAFDSESQKTVFAGVARTAETILYGSQTAAPEFLEQVTRDGRELLQQLSATASTL